ncbi:MAG: EscU/YscU/HrcU family type III secretion system export apparatus switch protein [Pirellulales bacterium]
MADSSDRMIPATPRRREAARREGAMPTAAVPAWVATAGTAVLLLPAWAAATLPAARDLVRTVIAAAGRGDEPPLPIMPVALPTIAVIMAAALGGLAVRFLADGFTWQPSRATPLLRRIDPFRGLARIFSIRTLAGVGGASLGLGVLVVAAGAAIGPLLTSSAAGPLSDAGPLAAVAWRSAAWMIAAAAAVAVVRWLLARRRFEQQIRMTPEEFAEEARGAQADPKIRLLQQQRRRQAGAA